MKTAYDANTGYATPQRNQNADQKKLRMTNHVGAWFVFFCLFLLLGSSAQALDSGVKDLRETGKAFAAIARAVSPSVAFIQVEGKVAGQAQSPSGSPFGNQTPFGDDFLRRFFGDRFQGLPQEPGQHAPQPEHRVAGQGSGFVFSIEKGLLSNKSYILTNNHVVENADKIRVRFEDEREFEGKVTGTDPQSDIAIIEIAATDLPALKLADSSALQVGEWVVAIGNPFGLSNTLTVGVVSATGRSSLGINDYEDFIQTDAAINPGNSGGPLVNLDGEVVGINTAIFSRSGGYMGVGFAIPSDLVEDVAMQLIKNGKVTRGYLGIVIQPLTADLAKSFDLESSEGILVSQVNQDSPAARAGLRQGDVIVAYSGAEVKNIGSFRNHVALTEPGSREPLTIVRDGKRKKLKVTIGALGEGQALARQDPQQSAPQLGLAVQTLTPELAQQFDAAAGEGVVVTAVQPGSVAASAGIEPGTVILQANRKQVASAADFKRLVAASNNNNVLLLVRQNGTERFVVLNW